MTNSRYDNYAQHLAGASSAVHAFPSWEDNVKAVLVDTALYSVNIGSHQDLADIPSGARVATATVTGINITGGVVNFNPLDFGDVTGDTCEAVVFYVDSGSPSTSPLMLYIDDAPGLPITPTGGPLTGVLNAAGLISF